LIVLFLVERESGHAERNSDGERAAPLEGPKRLLGDRIGRSEADDGVGGAFQLVQSREVGGVNRAARDRRALLQTPRHDLQVIGVLDHGSSRILGSHRDSSRWARCSRYRRSARF
jgi:hypothetical protein